MTVFGSVIKGLETPDDQGRDWYGWTANQMAHAMLGVIIALYFPNAPLQMAMIAALLKEGADIMRVPMAATVKDSLLDATFWLLGAWVACTSHLTLVVWFLAFALICGVIPRVRKGE